MKSYTATQLAIYATGLACLLVQTTNSKNYTFTPSSIINTSPNLLRKTAFYELLQLGAENHLPIGIVVGPQREICATLLEHRNSKPTIASFIDEISGQIPSYTIELVSGVLYLHPKDLPMGVKDLLSLRLPIFTANPGTLDLQATDLWLHIRGVLAPTEGTAYVLSQTKAADTYPGFRVNGSYVLSILDMIISQKHGGAWVMDGSNLNQLSSHTLMPFSIRGYMGEETHFAEQFRCTEAKSDLPQ